MSIRSVTTVLTFHARPGHEDDLRATLAGGVPAARARAGNVAYALHQGVDDTAEFVLYEVWDSPADQQAHSAHPDSLALREALGGLLSGPPARTTLRPVPEG